MRAATWLLVPLILLVALLPARAGDLGRDLGRVLRRGEPDARVRVLREAAAASQGLSAAERRRAAVEIRRALETEREGEVRAAMIHALSRLGGKTGWAPVIRAAREVTDDVLRRAGRQALRWGGGDYLEVLADLLAEESDPTWRARLLLDLADRRKPDAVPLLLERLGDDHPRVRAAAAEALEAITGRAHGYDVEAWGAFWDGARERLLAPPATRGETVTTAGQEEIPEPPAHVTRSLVPEFFGLRLVAKDVVFVLDVSGSVGTGGVQRLKQRLVDAVELLGSDVRVAALFFDEQVHMWKPEMVRATPEHKAELALFLRGIEPGRRTDVFTPLNAGLQIVRRRVAELEAAGQPIREAVTLIVVSDGVETAGQTPPHIVEDKLSRLDPAHTIVHAVALGGRGSALLAELARRGGGHYVSAP